MKTGPWELLLVGLLVSPIIIETLFLQTMWGLLTVEIVPADQQSVPLPREGDKVEVYGTWVHDEGHTIPLFSWNEIHPAIFLHNIDTGAEGGTTECKLLTGVHSPGRLRILDPADPCKRARGRAQFVFRFSDGDWHVDLRLDPEFQNLANAGPPMLAVSFPIMLILLGVIPEGFGAAYLTVSIVNPHRTILGRLVRRSANRK